MTSRIRQCFPEFTGVNVTVMGLGAFGGGAAAIRYLAESGARVCVTDQKSQQLLQASLDLLSDLSLDRVYCGEHPPEAFATAEVLVVNPAVRSDHPLVKNCREAGVRVTSEIELFLSVNPAKVVAVTGSNGKSTTASLIAHLLAPKLQASGRNVWLGGNIGVSLLPIVSQISEDDVVVLELSSFQLEYLRESGFAPDVAVVTNLSTNHIDWHGSFESYKAAKQVLLQCQTMSQVAVVPSTDEARPEWRIRGRVMLFGLNDTSEDGTFFEDGSLILRQGAREDAIRLRLPRQLAGNHNILNVTAAACAAWVVGGDPDCFQQQLDSFESLPHRLQFVGEGRGLIFYNDSNATTPESTIAALSTMTGNVVLIAGGADKGSDFQQMCHAIASQCVAAVFIGETAATLQTLVQENFNDGAPFVAAIADDFAGAFAKAVALVPERGIVLLSPGCASFGWFRDYRDRGEQFEKMAKHWILES